MVRPVVSMSERGVTQCESFVFALLMRVAPIACQKVLALIVGLIASGRSFSPSGRMNHHHA